MLHQQNSHAPLSQQQSAAAAAATVGTASLLTSSITASNGNNIKSQSAAPIKLDSSTSGSVQKSELRPRLVFLSFIKILT